MKIRMIEYLHIDSQEIKNLKNDLKQKFGFKVSGRKLSGSCRNCAEVSFPTLDNNYNNRPILDEISRYLGKKGYYWGCDTHQNTLLTENAWHCWNVNSVMIARIEGI